MLQINKMLTTKNCYINKNKPDYIVIHETDNWSKGAGAKKHAEAMYNGNLEGTVHYYVDDKSIYQTLDHKHGAYAVGDSGNKVNNSKYGIHNWNSINIEICVNPDSDYDKAVLNAIDLVKYLMKQENISIDKVVRHYDATRKNCPRKILSTKGGWENFKEKCKEETEVIAKTKIRVDGKVLEFEAIVKDGTTYVKLRDFSKAGYKVDYIDNIATINKP